MDLEAEAPESLQETQAQTGIVITPEVVIEAIVVGGILIAVGYIANDYVHHPYTMMNWGNVLPGSAPYPWCHLPLWRP